MNGHITIEKNLKLPESADFYLLRQKGIEYITQLGSRWWTDYNLHDPGITAMEAAAYALTEAGYRTNYEIRDLLAQPEGKTFDPHLQAFFSGREILTVNPWTIDDFRKLLIDLEGVRNAWLVCKNCPCEMKFYVDCKKSRLSYDPPKPPEIVDVHEVFAKGLFDVLLEFDEEERLGDLNSGKIKHQFSKIIPGEEPETIFMEVRLPSYQELINKIAAAADADKKIWKNFFADDSSIISISATAISGNKQDNQDIANDKLATALRKPMYVTLKVTYSSAGNPSADLTFEDVPFNLLLIKDAVRKSIKVEELRPQFESASPSGIVKQYQEKLKRVRKILIAVREQLHSHRNLAEDFCSIQAVGIEDIAVCADMEVTPDSDIEKILAEAYYQIENYFAPEIKFYSLQEWMDEGRPVEEIFEGPALRHGFIDTKELEATSLKKVLHTSDIINLLMDIPGVKAVKNLVLTRFDREGKLVQSEPWKLEVKANYQPRLFIEGSKFLVFKNNLPFLPDLSELVDTLRVIRGGRQHPKLKDHELDLEYPKGRYQSWEDYFPIQYTFPLTYGIGYEGLPNEADPMRKAQAKQLKAYLLFFEQFLGNYLAQLSHVSDLFALDLSVSSTYFSRWITNKDIREVESELYDGLDAPTLQGLMENEVVFLNRRNRFLNHLLARFAEEFTDYAMMLYANFDKKTADEKLIKNKILFLKEYPFISRNRARSFNYKNETTVCSGLNVAGLHTKVADLLGFNEFINFFDFSADPENAKLLLLNNEKKTLLETAITFSAAEKTPESEKFEQVSQAILERIFNKDNYDIKRSTGLKFKLTLLDKAGNILASHNNLFRTKAEAESMQAEVIAFAEEFLKKEQFHIVEHLLLRPRFTPATLPPDGDPLLPICVGPDCKFCGDEDPYSFLLTFVMRGESGEAKTSIPFRRYAEDTIRRETPAHLVVKICWVSAEKFDQFEKAWCEWLKELAMEEPDPKQLSDKLKTLLGIFSDLHSVYPPASLHDCVDGNDENRVYLGQTIISKSKKTDS